METKCAVIYSFQIHDSLDILLTDVPSIIMFTSGSLIDYLGFTKEILTIHKNRNGKKNPNNFVTIC